MGNIYKFLQRMNQTDRFIHTTRVDMKRSEANENLTKLHMEFTLFDLTRKKVGKSGA
jgi:hypothetical protein